MLDINIVSELARKPKGAIAGRIAEVGPDAICVSIITSAELHYGCARKGSPKLLAQIEAIFGSMQVLTPDMPAAPKPSMAQSRLMGIASANGRCVIVGRDVDVEALRRILRGLGYVCLFCFG